MTDKPNQSYCGICQQWEYECICHLSAEVGGVVKKLANATRELAECKNRIKKADKIINSIHDWEYGPNNVKMEIVEYLNNGK